MDFSEAMAREDEERRCFVGRLPGDIAKEDLRFVFKTYGKVTDIRLHEREGQKHAIITYEAPQSAEAACQVLNEEYRFTEDCVEPITCTKGPGPRGGGGPFGGNDRGLEGGGGGGRGPAFRGKGAGFRSRSPAFERAGMDFDRRGGMGGFGREPFMLRDPGFDRGFGGDKGKGGGGRNFGTKIYVANLPPDINRDALEYVFGMYGRITDLHVMSGRSKTGQGCAFVTYLDALEARRCIAAMAQGYEIRPGDGELLVKYADGHESKGKGKGMGRMRPF